MNGRIACLLAGLTALAPALPQATLVYASNYDAVLRTDGETGRVRSRARVRDGHAIPVEFGRHKVDIAVSGRAAGRVEIELRLFEKSGGSWYPINSGKVSFLAQLETPVEFTWAGAGIELDLALVVSVFQS